MCRLKGHIGNKLLFSTFRLKLLNTPFLEKIRVNPLEVSIGYIFINGIRKRKFWELYASVKLFYVGQKYLCDNKKTHCIICSAYST